MTGAEYAYLADFLNQRSGLWLGDDKRYLVEARLEPIARQAGAASLSGLVAMLARGGSEALEASVVEAMTTNETYFFRDQAPFTQFTDVMLPALLSARAGEKKIRIWSAACSTGQEAFSLAMLLEDRAEALKGWRIEIFGTDISSDVIERARSGLFSQFEVQRGLPIKRLLASFEQEPDGWRISPAIRSRVQFRTLNLKRDFSALGRFDIVFCRNVLMYFDARTRADVLARIARQTAQDGYLVMGAAETVGAEIGAPFRPNGIQAGLFSPAYASTATRPKLVAV